MSCTHLKLEHCKSHCKMGSTILIGKRSWLPPPKKWCLGNGRARRPLLLLKFFRRRIGYRFQLIHTTARPMTIQRARNTVSFSLSSVPRNRGRLCSFRLSSFLRSHGMILLGVRWDWRCLCRRQTWILLTEDILELLHDQRPKIITRICRYNEIREVSGSDKIITFSQTNNYSQHTLIWFYSSSTIESCRCNAPEGYLPEALPNF